MSELISVIGAILVIGIIVMVFVLIVFVWTRGFFQNNVGRAKTLFDFFVSHRGWAFEPLTDSVTIRPRHFFPKTWGYSNEDKEMQSFVASKTISGNTIWMIYEKYTYRTDSGPSFTWKFYFVTHFSRRVPGFVRIGPEDSLDAKFKADLELESIHFNKKVYIGSKPPKMVWSVVPPDFMDWYLRLKQKPWITVEDNVCSIDIRDTPSLELVDQCIDHTIQIAEFVEKSGALEMGNKKNE